MNTNEVLEQAASFKGRLKKEMTDAMAKVQYAPSMCWATNENTSTFCSFAVSYATYTPRAHHTRILHKKIEQPNAIDMPFVKIKTNQMISFRLVLLAHVHVKLANAEEDRDVLSAKLKATEEKSFAIQVRLH